MRLSGLEPVHVRYIPTDLEIGKFYVSLEYATASHLCVCGCGCRVVTPLGKADWILTFDGTVSLHPSIGNGQFLCGSHYWIRQNKVVWAPKMSRAEVKVNQMEDEARRDDHYGVVAKLGLIALVHRWLRR
ncbi:DUF6527 family protein [Cryobacterium aureum]|uniref:DUF6527 family protein n=1 Tax=Cryobacterium aureum TaxID=995037 RepID=UPI0034DFA165